MFTFKEPFKVVLAFISDESCCQRVFKSYSQVGQKCRKLMFLLHRRGTRTYIRILILLLVTAIVYEHVESQVDKF